MSKVKAALRFLDAGYAVIPVVNKRPVGIRSWKAYQNELPDRDDVKEWWRQFPDADIALICGWNDLAVLDIDNLDLAREVINDGAILRKTWCATTPKGGLHIFFRESTMSKNGPIAGVGDVKAGGGYVVIPPAEGREWIGIDIEEEPEHNGNVRSWAEKWFQHFNAFDKEADDVREGTRNDTLTRLGGRLRAEGKDYQQIFHALLQANKEFQPPLDREEVRTVARSVMNYEPRNNKSKASSTSANVHPEQTPGVKLRSLSTVDEPDTTWLWDDRVPMGAITMVWGHPESGKSHVASNLAVSVTRGRTMHGNAEKIKGKVLWFLSGEESEGILKARLREMGADTNQVYVVDGGEDGDRLFDLNDVASLDEALGKSDDFVLMVLDPLNSFIPTENNNNEQAIRSVLSPLAKLASRRNIAVFAIGHFGKGKQETLIQRGIGSTAFGAFARSALIVHRNPHDPDTRVVFTAKHSLVESRPDTLVFQLGAKVKQRDKIRKRYDGEIKDTMEWRVVTRRFKWRKPRNDVREEMLLAPDTNISPTSVEMCVKVIRSELEDGPMSSEKLRTMLRKAGFQPSVMHKALDMAVRLERKSVGNTGEGGWQCVLNDEYDDDPYEYEEDEDDEDE